MPCPAIPKELILSTKLDKGCIHYFDAVANDPFNGCIEKARPYMIISRLNYRSNRVIMSPISDIKNYSENGKLKYPYHAELLKSEYNFLDKDSVLLLDQVITVQKIHLWEEWFIGQITNFKDIDMAIYYNYDLFESINDVFNDFVKQLQQNHLSKYARR